MSGENKKGYAMFMSDKFIGRSKPVIVVCYDTSNMHRWFGRWVVITDDFIQCSFSRECSIKSDGEHALTDFIQPEWMIEELRKQAEGFFNFELQNKHQQLWKDLFYSAHPPTFVQVTSTDVKGQIFRAAFFSETIALAIFKDFSKRCGNKEVFDMIDAAAKFKVSIEL
jgi:hypothetical protein